MSGCHEINAWRTALAVSNELGRKLSNARQVKRGADQDPTDVGGWLSRLVLKDQRSLRQVLGFSSCFTVLQGGFALQQRGSALPSVCRGARLALGDTFCKDKAAETIMRTMVRAACGLMG
ncbi:MAG TPA: hypothetical protein DCY79_22495 [Planctomycetaceae bacterium]|nr:hypothetical protein [Blastopirellula sp.]HAY82587.1 hypothetical protein [Planctomycetaceae bacterium]